MHRLFVAIHPPAAIRDQLRGLMHGIAGARWQSDDQLHLTLRFIGEVDRHLAEDIASALGQISIPAFEIALKSVGSFETDGKRSTLWVGIDAPQALKSLHSKIESAFRPLGLEPDHRRFLPHVTIARLNRNSGPIGDFLVQNAGLASTPFPVSHFHLIESFLSLDGARYESIARYPL